MCPRHGWEGHPDLAVDPLCSARALAVTELSFLSRTTPANLLWLPLTLPRSRPHHLQASKCSYRRVHASSRPPANSRTACPRTIVPPRPSEHPSILPMTPPLPPAQPPTPSPSVRPTQWAHSLDVENECIGCRDPRTLGSTGAPESFRHFLEHRGPRARGDPEVASLFITLPRQHPCSRASSQLSSRSAVPSPRRLRVPTLCPPHARSSDHPHEPSLPSVLDPAFRRSHRPSSIRAIHPSVHHSDPSLLPAHSLKIK